MDIEGSDCCLTGVSRNRGDILRGLSLGVELNCACLNCWLFGGLLWTQ